MQGEASQSKPPATNNRNDGNTTSSVNYALDPTSQQAKDIIQGTLNLSSEQYNQITKLSKLIVQWNDSINLISRKDCTVDVVFGRHVLPSLALLKLPNSPFVVSDTPASGADTTAISIHVKYVIDVGTGGGFPGVPLAIACPLCQFTLVDSVGKKLKVVQTIADELGLTNVQTHHGRVEDMIYLPNGNHKRKYHVCVGRSVAALPKFCSWIDQLLREENGKLVYIIGGDIEDMVASKVMTDEPLEDLLDLKGSSDKRTLVLSELSVAQIAEESGEKRAAVVPSLKTGGTPKPRAKKVETDGPFEKPAKGEWKKKKDNSVPKQRGYEGFKRFDSRSN